MGSVRSTGLTGGWGGRGAAIALVGACLLAAGAAAPEHGDSAAAGVWRPYTPTWDVRGVGRDLRSLELVYTQGCGERNPRATVRETTSNVIVSFAGEYYE